MATDDRPIVTQWHMLPDPPCCADAIPDSLSLTLHEANISCAAFEALPDTFSGTVDAATGEITWDAETLAAFEAAGLLHPVTHFFFGAPADRRENGKGG